MIDRRCLSSSLWPLALLEKYLMDSPDHKPGRWKKNEDSHDDGDGSEDDHRHALKPGVVLGKAAVKHEQRKDA